ncbi:hypothetical protein Ddc_23275 [Ditylenchus destructor]|nr:hypothetical protein Ddc_23275 [Ditylenchus destructor]
MSMVEWVTPSISSIIIDACDHISINDFDQLLRLGMFSPGAEIGVKRAILEYLCGDVLDESELPRVGKPDATYLERNLKLYEIEPRYPSDKQKRVEFPLLIDGEESDLTLILNIYKSDAGAVVRIYDARTL